MERVLLRYPSRKASIPRIWPPAQQKELSPLRACSHMWAEGKEAAQFFSWCTIAVLEAMVGERLWLGMERV